MGRWRSRSTRKRHAGISVAPLLVIFGGDLVDIGEGLVGVDYDEVRGGYPRVRIVRTETSVEDGKDSVICGVYGGGCRGRNKVYEVTGRDGVGRGRHRGVTATRVAVESVVVTGGGLSQLSPVYEPRRQYPDGRLALPRFFFKILLLCHAGH